MVILMKPYQTLPGHTLNKPSMLLVPPRLYTGYILTLGHSFAIGKDCEKVITTLSSACLSCKHLLRFRSDAVQSCDIA
jgi:hypothetical protein